MKKILEIPHMAQYLDIDDDFWQGRSCGIVSLAMVLDYYGTEVPLPDLIQMGLDKGGYIDNVGWKHQSIVDLAQEFGFGATRSEDDTVENIIKAIDKDEPVIISIHKYFKPENGGHLAVLNGYFMDRDGELMGFYVNDPIGAPYKHKNQFIELEDFLVGWKKRSIYVFKK